MNHIEDFLCIEFKEFIPSAISSSDIYCGLKLGIAEFVFVSVSSESLSLGYLAPGISSLSFWLCGSRLFIVFSLNLESTSSAKSLYDSNLYTHVYNILG